MRTKIEGYLCGEDVRQLLHCGNCRASILISTLNKELEEKGEYVLRGKVQDLYCLERLGCFSELANPNHADNVKGFRNDDVQRMLGVSYIKASEIMNKINKKIKARGFLTFRGVVLSPFFYKEFEHLSERALKKENTDD